ncbi:MAG: response regulator, partial [Thermodesulfovibrionales bacterium]
MNPLSDILDTTKGLNVLVVEDDPFVRSFIYDSISDKFNMVIRANDGLDGLEAFRKGRFDLIITDQKMPRMTGLSMVRE